MSREHTFPKFEQLKQETDKLYLVFEVAPLWLEKLIEYVYQVDYRERKREILEHRGQVREQFSNDVHKIESTYGTAVNRALRRRKDGEWPSLEISRLETDLADAKTAIEELRDDLENEYLTAHERQRLQGLEQDILNAREYARTKKEFDQKKPEIQEEIRAFDDRFEPYEDRNRFMISSDEKYLIEQSTNIWRQLSDLSRELKLHILPDEDVDWLGKQKSRFSSLANALPEYNEAFVENELEEYERALTSNHGELNKRQKKAVIRNDRKNLVDASAGTGKTLTLTHRFLYLLEKGVFPEKIVAITYMNDAADEMENRISEKMNISDDNLNISTIHGFALKICMEAAETDSMGIKLGEARDDLVEEYFEAALNNETPANNEFPEIYNQFYQAFQQFQALDQEDEYVEKVKSYYETWEEFVNEKLEKFIERAQIFDLAPSEIRSNLDESHSVSYEFGRAGSFLVEAYESIVAKESTPTDFVDMIRTARRIVEENPEKFGQRYNHILVDEYQDMSESTLGFIEALANAGDDTHLFVVGDDWQSIMGFAGSNIHYFTDFDELYDDVTETALKWNYRNPPRIVDAGRDLIAKSQAKQNEKPVKAKENRDEVPDDQTMQLHLLEGIYDSRVAAYTADRIEQAVSDGYDYNDIMILSRNDANSKYMHKLRKELEMREIPHTRPGYNRDYLPKSKEESLDYEITFEKGDVKLANQENSQGEIPIVNLQSTHSAKGTEAPIVIFLHAVGHHPDGIPIEQHVEQLLQPATEVKSKHIPEERRLFYVALTRAEEEFQVIAKREGLSQFVDDIGDYFSVTYSNPEICGTCTNVQPPQHAKQPYKATLDCGSFEADLVAWADNNPPKLIEGAEYCISDPKINSSKYGETIRYDKSTVEKISD